jgi:hypothetical protein
MIGTRRIQENAGALLNVLLNTLPTVHEPFIALLSYKWLLSLLVAMDCSSSHGPQEFCWVGECNCDLDSTPKAVMGLTKLCSISILCYSMTCYEQSSLSNSAHSLAPSHCLIAPLMYQTLLDSCSQRFLFPECVLLC